MILWYMEHQNNPLGWPSVGPNGTIVPLNTSEKPCSTVADFVRANVKACGGYTQAMIFVMNLANAKQRELLNTK